jgi:outer membrane protein assembly factor BamB
VAGRISLTYPLFTSMDALLEDIKKNDGNQNTPWKNSYVGKFSNHRAFRNIRAFTSDGIKHDIYFRTTLGGYVMRLQTSPTPEYFWQTLDGKKQKRTSDTLDRAITLMCDSINYERNK